MAQSNRAELIRRIAALKVDAQYWEREAKLTKRRDGVVSDFVKGKVREALLALGEALLSDTEGTHNLPERARFEKADAISSRAIAIAMKARKAQEGPQKLVDAANDERVNIGTTMETVRLLERVCAALGSARPIVPTPDEMVELKAIAKLLKRCQPGTDRINEWMV